MMDFGFDDSLKGDLVYSSAVDLNVISFSTRIPATHAALLSSSLKPLP
jgi:hypothetical protein